MDSPSMNFTARVMAEVEKASVKVADTAIIGKKAWIFISLFIGSIFVFSFFTGEKESTSPSILDSTLGKFDQILTNSLTFDLPEILTSPLFGLSVFALSSLLFLDYFLKNRKLSVKA